MAEAKAGQQDAQQDEQQQEGEQQEGAEGEGDEQQEQRQAERTYTQAELDRILGKVRKNARYLGRKEAEAELRAQGATATQARETVDRQQQQQAPVAPKREDFENYEDFLVARARHEAKLASREEREASEKAAREKTVGEQKQKTEREFRKRAEQLMTEIPDFAETIESAEGVMISGAMGEAIQESPIGPRILYHLVKHPDDADRISQLSPSAAMREIGKLEARIEAEIAAKAKKKGKDQDDEQEEDAGEGEAGDDDKGGEEREESEAEAKGKDGERNADGTFKPAKKRAAPEPIEPGSARSATGSKTASDKDDIKTWMRKENERAAREGRK